MFEDFKSAFDKQNNAHAQLIIINVVVFAVLGVLMVVSKLSGFGSFFEMIYQQFSIPARLNDFLHHPWTILTYSFTHDLTGIFHILFNMMVLFWFGKLFVEYLGSDKLIAVYVLGALGGAILYLVAYNTIPYFIESAAQADIRMVGASAAVNAIVVATATLLPEYTFHLLLIGPVRIKYIAMVTVFLSLIGTVGPNAGGNVAHIGGALIGFVYLKQLQQGINWGAWITVFLDWCKGLFKAQPKVKVSYRNEKKEKQYKRTTSPTDTISQDEIDAILDKISVGGYESLSRDEKEKLFNASK